MYAQLLVQLSKKFVYSKEMRGLLFPVQTFAVNKVGNLLSEQNCAL